MCAPNENPPGPSDMAKNYPAMLAALVGGLPELAGAEATYKPEFVSSALNALGQTTPDWLSQITGSAPELSGLETSTNAAAAGGQVDILGLLGPSAAAAVREVNPTGTNLADQSAATAQAQLAAGTQLAPEDANRITSATRSDWSARGLGSSPAAMLAEAVNTATAGQNLLATRESAANSAAQLENQLITAPAAAITQGQSNVPGMASNLVNTAAAFSSNAGPTVIPQSQAYDVFNTDYNAMANAQIAKANNQAAMMGSMMSY